MNGLICGCLFLASITGVGAEEREITLVLAGDVMTGRAIDLILPHPGDPTLHERYSKSARDYLQLAERASGPIDKPVPFESPWGDIIAHNRAVQQ